MNIDALKKIGFSDKTATVYLALLTLGPSSVRTLAEYAALNRGTTYDALKWLEERGVVTYYHKDTRQHFVAESPSMLHSIIDEQKKKLQEANKELDNMLPELYALHHKGGERPVAKYYDRKELRFILEDVLATCEQAPEAMYRIYSTEGLREFLYEDFPTFSDARVSKGIQVRAIAIGEGGTLRGLDERKWISQTNSTPTYIMLYPGKSAYISLNAKQEPVGVVIENDGVYETQRRIFDELWGLL